MNNDFSPRSITNRGNAPLSSEETLSKAAAQKIKIGHSFSSGSNKGAIVEEATVKVFKTEFAEFNKDLNLDNELSESSIPLCANKVNSTLDSMNENFTNPLPPRQTFATVSQEFKEPPLSTELEMMEKSEEELGLMELLEGNEEVKVGVEEKNVGIEQENVAVEEKNVGIEQENVAVEEKNVEVEQKNVGITEIKMEVAFTEVQQRTITKMRDDFAKFLKLYAKREQIFYGESILSNIHENKIKDKAREKIDRGEDFKDFTEQEHIDITHETLDENFTQGNFSRMGPDGTLTPLTRQEFEKFKEDFTAFLIEQLILLGILKEKPKGEEDKLAKKELKIIDSKTIIPDRGEIKPKDRDNRTTAILIHDFLILQDIIKFINQKARNEKIEEEKEKEYWNERHIRLQKEIILDEIKRMGLKTSIISHEILVSSLLKSH
jgi:hypothetical protein